MPADPNALPLTLRSLVAGCIVDHVIDGLVLLMAAPFVSEQLEVTPEAMSTMADKLLGELRRAQHYLRGEA